MAVCLDVRYITLLDEFCRQYKLFRPKYKVSRDSVKITVGGKRKRATATTQLEAKEQAAKKMYKYLRRHTPNAEYFVEVDAFKRAEERHKAKEMKKQAKHPNPPLNIAEADYHRGLQIQFSEYERTCALAAMGTTQDIELQLERAAAALGVEVIYDVTPRDGFWPPMVTVELTNTTPSLIFLGDDRSDAATSMIHYMKIALF